MFLRKVAVVGAAATMNLAACGGGGSASPPGGGTACPVGVAWNNYDQERWKQADETAIQTAAQEARVKYIKTDGRDSPEHEIIDIDTLTNQGAKALNTLAKDADAIKPAVAKAESQNIPVIAYDRLIEDPKAF